MSDLSEKKLGNTVLTLPLYPEKWQIDIIEKRFDDTWFTKETALKENIKNLELCKQNNCCYILINDRYDVDIEINRPETFSVVP